MPAFAKMADDAHHLLVAFDVLDLVQPSAFAMVARRWSSGASTT